MVEYLMRFQAIKNIKEIFILVEKTRFLVVFFFLQAYSILQKKLYTQIFTYVLIFLVSIIV